MENLKALYAANKAEFIKHVEKHFDCTLENEPETDIDYRKEFADSPENVEFIKAEKARGNGWAWCMVDVSVTIGTQTATEYLGGCSYKGKSDFKHADGYYPQMLLECLETIYKDAQSIIEKIG